MNQLSNETSPYLKQHSSNPVDWRPWGQAALEEAKAKERLVLLSVGYSTCHWCHVMKRESFENSQVAEVMNALYVPIKVDREERPDIDSVYMLATQFLTGQGGWPMTVWLTPELKPIYDGTYFPTFDGDRGVRFGFYSLLSKIAEEYQENREQVLASAENVSNYLLDHFPSAAGETLPDRSTCLERLLPSYDEINGGTNGLAEVSQFTSS